MALLFIPGNMPVQVIRAEPQRREQAAPYLRQGHKMDYAPAYYNAPLRAAEEIG
jgi:hypothetical protein